jgi:hypothetical protein
VGKEERTRLEIAFDGGQIVGALVTAAAADALEKALGENTNGAHELQAEDGTYVLPLARIVYVKRFSRETTIGFGGLT